MELSGTKKLLAILLLTVVGAALVSWLLLGRSSPNQSLSERPIPGSIHKFRVEVLNGTTVSGYARATTRTLRAHGIDVVFFGTAQDQDLDSTRIVVRAGDTTAAVIVRDALGGGKIEVDADPNLMVEISVFLGLDLSDSLAQSVTARMRR